MPLTRLALAGFRNLKDNEIALPEPGVAVIAPNARGKTNFLEAIHYLEMFRSFRRARDEDVVTFGHDLFRVEGVFNEQGREERTISAAFQKHPRKKKVVLGGREVAKLGDAIGSVATVLFTPGDLRILREGPSDRRRFLDILLSLNDPAYLRALQAFRQALLQRNAALRDRQSPAVVSAWDPALVRSGAEVSWARARWIHERSAAFDRFYAEISGASGARMGYRSNVGAAGLTSVEEVMESYHVRLHETRDSEAKRRMTLVGPHRDDLTFVVEDQMDGRDLREYGSGGEQRTAALALKVLEAETARDLRGMDPILLLDDVFAELDGARSERTMGLLDRLAPSQVILTAPKETDVRFQSDLLARWTINDGLVEC